MIRDPRMAVCIEAVAVGMRAMVGGVTRDDVERMRQRAAQSLEPEDPMLLAVTGFVAAYPEARGDPAALAEIGSGLRDAVERAFRPDPVDAGRRDIHG